MLKFILLSYIALAIPLQATLIFNGTSHTSGGAQNNWSSCWDKATYPNQPGTSVTTAKKVVGDMVLLLNQDVTIANLDWACNLLSFSPGTPAGKFIIDNDDKNAQWNIDSYYGCKIDTDVILKSDWIISNYNASILQLNGNITGDKDLKIIWNPVRIGPKFICKIGKINSTKPNTYMNTYLTAVNSGTRGNFELNKNGALGQGNVYLNSKATLNLKADAADMINDSASIFLVWNNINNSKIKIEKNINEVVQKLYINGKQQFAGSYGASGSGAKYENDDFFAGQGIMTVTDGGIAPAMATTLPATKITTTSFVANGQLIKANASPSYGFIFYGSKNGGIDPNSWQKVINLGTLKSKHISKEIKGFSPLDKIYYRIAISNKLGLIWSSPINKVKLHGPPELEILPAFVNTKTIEMRAKITATNGFQSKAVFFWGPKDGRSNPKKWRHSVNMGLCPNGILSKVLENLKSDQTNYYRIFAQNKAGKSWSDSSQRFIVPGQQSKNDFTFFTISDTHYKTSPEVNEKCHRGVARINGLPGTPFPESFYDGYVQVPRGVIIIGDLIDNGAIESERFIQWDQWTNDFGVNGEGRLNFPVYEGLGNHDLHLDKFLNKEIIKRTKRRRNILNTSPDGLHYSWDWGKVHFLQLNLFPGNVHKSPNYGPAHDPVFALDFMKADLAKFVGDSGRPVIISHHYDPRDNWWTEEQKTNFFNAIKPYNITCLIHGHTGTGIYKWRGLDVVNDGNFPASIFVFQIKDDQLYVIQRTVEDEWKITLKKPLF